MSDLSRIAGMLSGVEKAIEAEDWDALEGFDVEDLEPATPGEERAGELRSLVAEVERLQARIALSMAEIQAEIADAPRMRRAATAYMRAELTTGGSGGL